MPADNKTINSSDIYMFYSAGQYNAWINKHALSENDRDFRVDCENALVQGWGFSIRQAKYIFSYIYHKYHASVYDMICALDELGDVFMDFMYL